MKLILIRHGQTPSNVAGLLDTAPPGPGLTPLGELQASAVPLALAQAPIDAVFASNQTRAQLTAEPLSGVRELTPTILPDLREIAAGELEMAGDIESIRSYIGTLYAWLGGDMSRRIPGGPSGTETLDRYDAAVDEIVSTVGGDGIAVAVSHGAAIRVWSAARGANIAAIAPDGQHLDNTGAVMLNRDARGIWTIESWLTDPIGGAHIDGASGPTA